MKKIIHFCVSLLVISSQCFASGASNQKQSIQLQSIVVPKSILQEIHQTVANRSTGISGIANSSVSTPSALGGEGPVVFAAVSSGRMISGRSGFHTSTIWGGGFGNARKTAGVSVGFIDDGLLRGKTMFHDGGISIRLNRYVAKNTAIALGAANMVGWRSFSNLPHSYYAVVSHSFSARFPVTASLGMGSGLYHSQADVSNKSDRGWYPFANVGVLVYPGLSVMTDYLAQRISFGLSYTPNWSRQWLVAFNLGLVNVIGPVPSGMRRAGLSAGAELSYVLG